MPGNLPAGSDTGFSGALPCGYTFKRFCGLSGVFFLNGFFIGFSNEPLVQANGFFSDALIFNF
jgi:hypothetical protein